MKLLSIESMSALKPKLKTEEFPIPDLNGGEPTESLLVTQWTGLMRDSYESWAGHLNKTDQDSIGYATTVNVRAYAICVSLVNEQGFPLFADKPIPEIETYAKLLNQRLTADFIDEVFNWLDEMNLITNFSRRKAMGNSSRESKSDSGTNSPNDGPALPPSSSK